MNDLISKLNHRLNPNYEKKRSSKKIEILEGHPKAKPKTEVSNITTWCPPKKSSQPSQWDSILQKKKQKSRSSKHTKCREEIRKLFPLKVEPILQSPNHHQKSSRERFNASTAKKSNKTEAKEYLGEKEVKIENEEKENFNLGNEEANEEDPTFDEIAANLIRVKEYANELSKFIPVYKSPQRYKFENDYSNSMLKKEANSLKMSIRTQSAKKNKSSSSSLVKENISSSPRIQNFTEKSIDKLNNTIYRENEFSDITSQKGFFYKLRCNSQAFKFREFLFKSQKCIEPLSSDINRNYLEMQKMKLEETERILSKQRFNL